MAKVLVNARLSPEAAEVIDELIERGRTRPEEMEALMADGARFRMERHDPPIGLDFIAEGFTPDEAPAENVLETYRRLLLVKAGKDGWHLEEAPKGGYWEKEGRAGQFRVMRPGENFTTDGLDYDLRQAGEWLRDVR